MRPGIPYCACVPSRDLSPSPIQGFKSPSRIRPPGKWGKRELTWAIATPHQDLKDSHVRQAFHEVFVRTEEICDLKFYPVGAGADINIHFVAIDGPRGTLGRAFYPSSSQRGKILMDAVELWGTADLISVGMHELGHCLGITHSPDFDDLMYASAMPPVPTEWQPGDIKRLQALYGPPTHGRWSPQPAKRDLWACVKRLFSWV